MPMFLVRPMHVLYIHQHFTTNQGASGTRSYDYARLLVQRGHKVTMVTGNYALGPFADVRGPAVQVRWIDGIRVVIVNVPYANQMSFWARMWSFVRFALLASWTCLRQGRVDVTLATSTPLTVALPAMLMRWLRGVPYVFEVRDIWPEVAVSMGALTSRPLIAAARLAERMAYRHAARVQTVSNGMVQSLARRVPRDKLAMVPTGVDVELYHAATPDASIRGRLGWQDRLLAVYAGAHGPANGLDYVLQAAAACRDDKRIAFLLIGDGKDKPRLAELARRMGLDNLAMEPKMPKSRLAAVLADAQVGLQILKPVPEFAILLPNKLFDYAAAGMAVCVNWQGDVSELLLRHGAGAACDPTDAASLAQTLVRWADRPDELAAARAGAKKLAQAYDRRQLAPKLEQVLLSAARST
jgi:glycosyltransferase involved in cell wall biosynthesis